MAAIEQKELTQSYTAGVAPGVVGDGPRTRAQLSLVKPGAENDGAAGKGHGAAGALPPSQDEHSFVEAGEFEARGIAAWWRLAQIARVLGTMSLYLFLNDYDIRAAFNRRAAERRIEEARARGRGDYFKAWARDLLLRRALDKLIRLRRFLVYRGAEAAGPGEPAPDTAARRGQENTVAVC